MLPLWDRVGGHRLTFHMRNPWKVGPKGALLRALHVHMAMAHKTRSTMTCLINQDYLYHHQACCHQTKTQNIGQGALENGGMEMALGLLLCQIPASWELVVHACRPPEIWVLMAMC